MAYNIRHRRSVGDGYEKLKYGSIAPKVFNIYCYGQTSPDPDSRLILDQERDALGLPRIKLDLRLTELGRRSIKRTLEVFATRLGECGLGRVKMAFDDWPAESRTAIITWEPPE